MRIERLDHFVLTVADVEATCDFYRTALGMKPISFGGGRRALKFGHSKINLHPAFAPLEPAASAPTPGSADICLIAAGPIEGVVAHLAACGVPTVAGPVRRAGALGPIQSVYLRDPDGNLVEVSVYEP